MESHKETMNSVLQTYTQKMKELGRNRNSVKGYAPHKPFLLLALIELIKHGKITESRIILSDASIEVFKKYSKLIPHWAYRFENPFFHLKNDGFWNLYPHALRALKKAPSLGKLRNEGAYVMLDAPLFKLLVRAEYREILRQTLISTYFPDLRESIKNLAIGTDAQEYSESLIDRVNSPFLPFLPRTDIEAIQEVKPPVRSAGFRRAIMEIYTYTCAVCELNIRASSGESVTDAAHIIPFFVSYNDDIRNGISLCKSHHWAFDTGLISVNAEYQVIVSPSMSDQVPPEWTSELRDRQIWLPEEEACFPAQDALTWHRQQVLRQ